MCRARATNFSRNTPALRKLPAASRCTAANDSREFLRRIAAAHADAAAAGGALEHHRIADALRRRERRRQVRQQVGARQQRQARASCASSRAVCLRPKSRICAGVGPMKAMPASSHICAKSRVLGQEAVAGMNRLPRRMRARLRGCARRADNFRRPAPARCRCASSASRTCREFSSASEYTATEPMPMRLTVRRMRHAMAPRLAIRIFLNIAQFPRQVVPALKELRDGSSRRWDRALTRCPRS